MSKSKVQMNVKAQMTNEPKIQPTVFALVFDFFLTFGFWISFGIWTLTFDINVLKLHSIMASFARQCSTWLLDSIRKLNNIWFSNEPEFVTLLLRDINQPITNN